MKALDLNGRTYEVVKRIPRDIFEKAIDVVLLEIEMLSEENFK